MAVLQVHKGALPADRLEIFTNGPDEPPNGMVEPWSYDLGGSYRVHAHSIDLGLSTGGCSRNLTTRQAAVEELDVRGRAGGSSVRFSLFAAVLGVGDAVASSAVRP